MDIKELVDTTLPYGAYSQITQNRQQNMSLPMQMNNRIVDRGPLPMFNMHMPPENFMNTPMPMMYNMWNDDNYSRRIDRPNPMVPPTPYMNMPSMPYPPMDNYGRYMNKPEHHYDSPEALYMLHQRESTQNPQWDNNFEKLREFYLTHGHCRVPKTTDSVLFAWCANQRSCRQLKSLSESRISKLDSIDFNWEEAEHPSPKSVVTSKRKTRAPKREVSDDESEEEEEEEDDDDFELSDDHAIHAITKMANSSPTGKGSFSPFRTSSSASPNAIKSADPKQTWDTYYQRLYIFYQQNNHCRIPYGQDRPLSTWISNQRAARNNNALTPEQITKLDAIGFIWNPKKGSGGNTAAKKAKNDEEWDKHFAKLKEFKEKQGHCCIPNSTDAWMNQWVRLQRSNEKRGLLSLERKKKLDAIGFPWVVPPAGARYAVYNGSSPTKNESQPSSPNSDANSPSSSHTVSPIPVENGQSYSEKIE